MRFNQEQEVTESVVLDKSIEEEKNIWLTLTSL